MLGQLLGQFIGDVEEEVALDDGDAGSGGCGAGILTLGQGKVTQDRVVASGLLVITKVGGGEGKGVVAVGDDGDIVTTEDNRNDRDDSMSPPDSAVIIAGQLGDTCSRGGGGECDGVIQVVAGLQQEAMQGIGVVAVATDLDLEYTRGDAVFRGVEFLHDATDAVAADVDDGGLGQEGIVAGVGVWTASTASIRVGLNDAPESAYGGLSAVDASLRHESIGTVHRDDGATESQAKLPH